MCWPPCFCTSRFPAIQSCKYKRSVIAVSRCPLPSCQVLERRSTHRVFFDHSCYINAIHIRSHTMLSALGLAVAALPLFVFGQSTNATAVTSTVTPITLSPASTGSGTCCSIPSTSSKVLTTFQQSTTPLSLPLSPFLSVVPAP